MTKTHEPLRYVIFGVGASVLDMHRPALQLSTVNIVGAADTNLMIGRLRAADLGCHFYDDPHEMLVEAQPDVAIVLTPHPYHAAIATECLNAGCHVLVEKPIAVEVTEADAMIAAAERAGRLLAVNLQHRYRPEMRTAKKIIDEGKLGRIQHVDMSVSWPRTASYYRSALWRATWRGEGGGVLLNQAPHSLDLLCYFLGMPTRVSAWTRNLLHSLEVEDTAQAMLEWPNGTLGSLHISTAEVGRPERFEVVGSGGYMQITGGRLSLSLSETDFETFAATSPDGFSVPGSQAMAVTLEAGEGNHRAIYENLHEAISRGMPLIADGAQGRMSLELANAMIYSSYTHSEVELPLGREDYAALLQELRVGRRVGS